MRDASLYGSDMRSGSALLGVHDAWRGLTRSSIAGLLALSLLCGCQAKQDSSGKKAGSSKKACGVSGKSSPVPGFLKANGLTCKVVLVEFGDLSCELSASGLDAMLEMSSKKKFPGLAFARLEASGNDSAVQAYYAKKALPFPMVRDKEGALAKALKATAFPSFVLLDKFGCVRYRGRFPTEEDLDDWVGALAAEKTRPASAPALFGKVELNVAELLKTTKLPELKGVAKSLDAYRGEEGLLLVFVDTDCPFAGAAIGEMPVVSKTLAQFDVPSVVVNISDPADVVADSYRTRKTGTPVVYDVEKATQFKWNIQSVPTVVFVTHDNRIAYNGPAVWADLASAMNKALSFPTGFISFSVQGTEYG